MRNCLLLTGLIIFSCSLTAQNNNYGSETDSAYHSTIYTEKAPKPIGPYSQAVISGNTVYCSGQIAINPNTDKLVNTGIKAETRQVLENLKNILNASGCSFENVIKVTIYMMDLKDFKEMNEIYAEYFKVNFPARETVQVTGLPKDAKIEISLIAVKKLK